MSRFTIRDVLWLTVVVAVALGLGMEWWRDRRITNETLEQAKYEVLVFSTRAAILEALYKPKADDLPSCWPKETRDAR